MSAEELGALPRGDNFVGNPLALICVSHAWLTREHPDPEAANLIALADAIEKKEEGKQ